MAESGKLRDPMNEQNRAEMNKPTKNSVLQPGETKPFGAIIISRSEYLNCMDTYKAYIMNPEVIKSYANKTSAIGLLQLIESAASPNSRILDCVNEIRIRNTNMQLVQNRFNESSSQWWLESQSGNEFIISSDLWSK